MKTADRKTAEQHLSVQYDVATVLATSSSLSEAAPKLLRAICCGLGWDLGALWAVDRRAGVLRCLDVWVAAPDSSGGFRAATTEAVFPRGSGLPGRVWESGRPLSVDEIADDPGFLRTAAAASAGLRSACAFPVTSGEEVAGVMEFFSRRAQWGDDDVLKMMASLGSQIGQFIQRKQAEEAVRESEARKTAILESALDCIVTMDHEGRITEFNPAAESTFGYRRDEVLGRRVAETIVPPSLRERHLAGIKRYLATGEASLLGKRLETTGMRSDGSEFPIELGITRVEVEEAAVFTAYLRDISDRVSAEESRKRAEQESAFLAEASSVLGASLDYETTLANVANLAVPHIADWCFIDVIEGDGSFRRLAIAHKDPARTQRAWEMERRFPSDNNAAYGASRVLLTGKAELGTEIPEAALRGVAESEKHLEMLGELGLRSYMTVPLVARGRTIGAITFATAESDRRYGRVNLGLAEELARRAALAVDNARLFRERSYIARRLQESLLPPQLPAVPGLEVAARYRAAGEGNDVGGDFYDLFETGQGAWAVVIGDACGKGVDAAAITGLARHTVRAAAMQWRRPSEILTALNEAILKQSSDSTFCTVCYVGLRSDDAGAQLVVSCGGHPPPLVVRADGTVHRAGRPGTLLGVFPDPEVHDHEVLLHEGDALVLYTDGVVEARRGPVIFGDERLSEVLGSCAGSSAEDIVEQIDRAVSGFQPDGPRDDVAIVALRVTGAQPGAAGQELTHQEVQ